MARNMHGVDETHEMIVRIANESGATAGFVAAMIEYYSEGWMVQNGWSLEDETTRDGNIVRNAMVAAFMYQDQDDDEDIANTEHLRAWAYTVANIGIMEYVGRA